MTFTPLISMGDGPRNRIRTIRMASALGAEGASDVEQNFKIAACQEALSTDNVPGFTDLQETLEKSLRIGRTKATITAGTRLDYGDRGTISLLESIIEANAVGILSHLIATKRIHPQDLNQPAPKRALVRAKETAEKTGKVQAFQKLCALFKENGALSENMEEFLACPRLNAFA